MPQFHRRWAWLKPLRRLGTTGRPRATMLPSAALVVVGVGTGASEDELLLQPVNARAPTTAPTTIVA